MATTTTTGNALTAAGTLTEPLWLVLHGDKLSIQTGSTAPAGSEGQVGATGDTVDAFLGKIAAAMFNLPSGVSIPATIATPGGGTLGIGASSPLSSDLGALENLFTGGPSAALNSPSTTTGQSVGSTGILAILGNVAFWKGVGLVLAGVLIIVFAALELKRYV